jgi:hypothetical protein
MSEPEQPPFVPGLELARRFYEKAVRPVLDERFSELRYSAALIGPGSEVLGYDTPMSTDHHWGPRAMLFVADDQLPRMAEEITEVFRHNLPSTFLGYSTHFAPPDPLDNGTQALLPATDGPINHRVEVIGLARWFTEYLGWDPAQNLSPADWLTFPEQKLLSIAAGGVFQDDLGLEAIRHRLAYYPHDIWLYVMATAWNRIGQDEHLMGRAGHAGDEIGSAVIGARLVRDVMRICFQQERRYAPYPKWLGTGFARLRAGPLLSPILQAALLAPNWQERAAHLAQAYEYIARAHNALGLTPPLPTETASFFGRPFPVIWGGGFGEALIAAVTDPEVRRIAAQRLIGPVDQFSDSTDLLSDAVWRSTLLRFYDV